MCSECFQNAHGMGSYKRGRGCQHNHALLYVCKAPVSDCEDLDDIGGSRFSSNLPSPEYNLVSNEKNIAESTTLDSCMGCFVDQYQV